MPSQETEISCPYCYATITVQIDTDSKGVDYVEDCSSCYNPIRMRVEVSGGVIGAITGEVNQ